MIQMRSEPLYVSGEHRPTFRQRAIVKTRSALARFFTASAIMLSVSLIGSSNVAALPPDMKNWQ